MRRWQVALAAPLERFASWPALVVWLLVIFGLSSIPNNFQESDSPIPADKIAHGIEFAVLGFIVAGVATRRVGAGSVVAAAAALLFSTAYGITDELHQEFVPGRDVSRTDLLADIIGGAVGAAVALWLFASSRNAGGAEPS